MISVIIPAYNEEKLIDRCLASVLKQDLSEKFEVIVVNNNSTDNTASIVEKYPVTIVNETNKGVIFAKQKGFLTARGRVVVLIDADSVAPKDWLKRISNHFNTPGVVGVTGPYQIIDGPQFHKLWVKTGMRSISVIYSLFKILPYSSGSNLAFLKDVADKFGGFDTKKNMGEDEIGIKNKLKKYGLIIWDPELIVKTSGRRASHGFLSFFNQTLLRYSLNYLTSLIFGKSIIPPYSDFR